MVITVTGNNRKKNKCVFATAALAGMNALTKGEKNIVIQLINPDLDSVESMMVGTAKSKTIIDEGVTFNNEGIDTLLRLVETNKVTKEEFDQMCLALRGDNRLDIAEMTKNVNFINMLSGKMEEIKLLIRYAQGVYDNIFLILPARKPDIVRQINELPIVDRCIYCIRQGYTQHSEFYGGSKAMLLITDFDFASQFTVQNIRNLYNVGKKIDICMIPYNINAKDAANMNKLYRFIAENRDVSALDINAEWVREVKHTLAVALKTENSEEIDYEWEKSKPWVDDLIYLGDGYHQLIEDEKIIANSDQNRFETETRETPAIHSEDEILLREQEQMKSEINQMKELQEPKKQSFFKGLIKHKAEKKDGKRNDTDTTLSSQGENVNPGGMSYEYMDIERRGTSTNYKSITVTDPKGEMYDFADEHGNNGYGIRSFEYAGQNPEENDTPESFEEPLYECDGMEDQSVLQDGNMQYQSNESYQENDESYEKQDYDETEEDEGYSDPVYPNEPVNGVYYNPEENYVTQYYTGYPQDEMYSQNVTGVNPAYNDSYPDKFQQSYGGNEGYEGQNDSTYYNRGNE